MNTDWLREIAENLPSSGRLEQSWLDDAPRALRNAADEIDDLLEIIDELTEENKKLAAQARRP